MTAASTATIPTQGKPPAILSLIGNTPLVEITRMDTGPCQLFVKLENQNPTGSIKDRIALSMIEAAEREGKLQPGGTIIEATAGNTGLGLALIAGAKGYRIILVIPDKMSQEKIAHVRALGAEVRMTRSDVTRGHPEYYQDVAARLADGNSGRVLRQPIRQPGQSTRARAHHRSGNLGADGSRSRCGRGRRRLRRNAHRSRPILFRKVQPRNRDDSGRSDRLNSVRMGQDRQTGEGRELGGGRHRRGFHSRHRRHVVTSPTPSRSTTPKASRRARALAQRRNPRRLLDRHAARPVRSAIAAQQTKRKRVVTFVCDTGNKYLSKMYNDFWMAEQGFVQRPPQGDLSDLISHRYEAGEVISVGPDDTLLTAFKRMRSADVSQVAGARRNRARGRDSR